MTEKTNYKETLNLPKTDFPMKASLAQREPAMLEQWENEKLYAAIRQSSAGKPKYILHDGPPYANGKIHIGHSLNKILKDIIVRYKTLRGFDAFYVPGWDCHGLPIEHQCLKDMGKRKEEVERVAFRKQARQYAEKFVNIQREEFKRLGVFGEWDQPYLTMNYGYQSAIAKSFLELYEKGYIYEGMKPVPWCFDCETALADAELEYADKQSTAVYVKFPFDSSNFPKGKKENSYLLIWTTTPWTLPANVGAAVHPELEYCLAEHQHEIYLLASSRLDPLRELLKSNSDFKILSRFKGEQIAGAEYSHPFLKRTGKIITADYVSATDGTGIVHIAPGHGEDDYVYGHVKNHLPVLSPVNHRGQFTEEFQEAKGLHVFKANPHIVEMLKGRSLLLAEEKHDHSYPHCWRCKKPIIFRATKQWFMKIDFQNLRSKMLDAIQKKIRFTPDWGKNRIGSMVETRPEWCLSRQRYWGVPIPMIRCGKCPGKFFAAESKSQIEKIFEKEGADAWFIRPAGDFLPEGFKCPACGGHHFEKETDIIDVWFDSGVSHQAVLKKIAGLQYPSDLYLEGSDQHRGWFQSSLTTAMALTAMPPFKGVLTHGFVVDGEGRKMSKSAGNVVAPQDVMKEFGADILRLWVSSCDYEYDVRLSKEILNQLADSYRKIRNTFRYMLSNLSDFDASRDQIPLDKLHGLDQWAIALTHKICRDVRESYDRFEFHQIYQQIHNFCVIQLSGYYFDVLKDTLYTAKADSFLRRSAQTAVFHILSRLVKVLAPILTFTMDEVWKSYSIEPGLLSVHQSAWKDDDFKVESGLYQEWSDVRALRNAITPLLEKKREEKIIGANLDAKLFLSVEHPEAKAMIQKLMPELPRAFVVSQVEWLSGTEKDVQEVSFVSERFSTTLKAKILVAKADGEKCSRCWNYSTQIGKDQTHPELCGKCLEAVKR